MTCVEHLIVVRGSRKGKQYYTTCHQFRFVEHSCWCSPFGATAALNSLIRDMQKDHNL